jgi:hypothetical protein
VSEFGSRPALVGRQHAAWAGGMVKLLELGKSGIADRITVPEMHAAGWTHQAVKDRGLVTLTEEGWQTCLVGQGGGNGPHAQILIGKMHSKECKLPTQNIPVTA